MIIEETFTGNTVEEAIQVACNSFNKSIEELKIDIIDLPKKSFFGKIKSPAKISASFEETEDLIVDDNKDTFSDFEKPEDSFINTVFTEQLDSKLEVAKRYTMSILNYMGYEDIELNVEKKDNNIALISLNSNQNIGFIIGKRGETIDSLQHLVSLVCNNGEKDYLKVILDIGNYREKRENTLKELAEKIANSVISTGKKSVLEPMNSYERKIIHSTISELSGVHSKSIGDEPNRKIIIFSNNKNK